MKKIWVSDSFIPPNGYYYSAEEVEDLLARLFEYAESSDYDEALEDEVCEVAGKQMRERALARS